MEGWLARWYARTRSTDMEEFRRQAVSVARHLNQGDARGRDVLEVAPGPGFFAVELARQGDFRITGLDISHTLVETAADYARKAGTDIDFRLGDASAMPFADDSFDFIYCEAAFKNFAHPVKALDEMYRVLRPSGHALVKDLRKDAPMKDIADYLRGTGRGPVDAWITRWTFSLLLLKRAYTGDDFLRMAERSRFGACRIEAGPVGFEVWFAKPAAPR